MANGTPVRDFLKRMAPGTPGRKSKRPTAARGKTTRKEKVKRTIQKIKANLPKKVGSGMNMSPGAMGGRTKTKMPDPKTFLTRLTPAQRRLRQIKGKTAKGAGALATPMAKQAMKLARQVKKTGRLSVQDLMRAKKMMMERKGN